MNIWFNHNFSSTAQLIHALQTEGVYHILASHKRADAVMLAEANIALTEPDLTSSEEVSEKDEAEFDRYLEWALEVCQKHQIEVLIPERYKLELTQHRERFEEVGTRLLVAAEPDVLELVEDKAALYAALPLGLVNVPPYRVVRSAAELDAALKELEYSPAESENGPNHRLCVKPIKGIFASGFRVLGEVRLEHLLRNALIISPKQLKDLIAERELAEPAPPFLVMRYLAGNERSVDCLAHQGNLIRCVVRRKGEGSAQELEDNPDVVEMAAELTKTLGLTGVYNIQFKDDDVGGTPYLLEINSRASGGLPMAMLSGLNFYHWALQLLTGQCAPEDIPEPRTGLRVAMGSVALALGEVQMDVREEVARE